ncbi:MAG: rhomboid family intramembrane serine protease [Pseudomonadota bacterium]
MSLGQDTKRALRGAAIGVAVLWLVHLVNALTGYELNRFGIWPRTLAGLPGIGLSPLLHANLLHLVANSGPFFVGLVAIRLLARRSALPVVAALWLGTGALVWLLGRSLIHVGASGVVYAMLAWIVVRGFRSGDLRGIILGVVIAVLYLPILVGVLPSFGPVSWESHLAGVVVGILLALKLSDRRLPRL